MIRIINTLLFITFLSNLSSAGENDFPLIKESIPQIISYWRIVHNSEESRKKISELFHEECEKLKNKNELFESKITSSNELFHKLTTYNEGWFTIYSQTNKNILSKWDIKKLYKIEFFHLTTDGDNRIFRLFIIINNSDDRFIIENNQDIISFVNKYRSVKIKKIKDNENEPLELTQMQEVTDIAFLVILLQGGVLINDLKQPLIQKILDRGDEIQSFGDASNEQEDIVFNFELNKFSINKKHKRWVVNYVLASCNRGELKRVQILLFNHTAHISSIKDEILLTDLNFHSQKLAEATKRSWTKIQFKTSKIAH